CIARWAWASGWRRRRRRWGRPMGTHPNWAKRGALSTGLAEIWAGQGLSMELTGRPWPFHPLAKPPPLDRSPRARRRRRALGLLGIQLVVLPPKSPQLNGHVERAQRTHPEEFYEVSERAWTVAPLNAALRVWEQVEDTVRPHQ